MSKMIEMKVKGILGGNPLTGANLLLGEKTGKTNKAIVVGIDYITARGIDVILRSESTPRPLTHELFEKALGLFGAEVDRIEITHIKDETFIGNLVLITKKGTETHLDSRPSDGIAMALRFGATILVAKKVFDKCARTLSKEIEDLLSESYKIKSKKNH